MKKKVSLKDVAHKVGVSTALVSYVLNGKAEEKQVGKEVALKILDVAREMNYSTNQIAKSLKTRKTNTIGFIVADVNYRYTVGVTKAIETECQKYNYTVLLGSSNENPKKFAELMNVLVNRSVDGLILVPVENCENEIEYLHKNEIPFVLIDRILPNVEANLIAIDNSKSAYNATVHMIQTGHKRIGFITYKTSLVNLLERKSGYLKALEKYEIPFDESLIKEVTDLDLNAQVNRAVDELIRTSSFCDSIFFATDTLAVNGLRHINALNIKVPERLGIVSFDEAEAFELFYCKITHGRQPLEEIGKSAVDMLLKSIAEKKKYKQVFLDTVFLPGNSCGED